MNLNIQGKVFNLPLDIAKANSLASNWTLVHVINEESPFYRRLKMLGAKNSPDASLSQGSFIKYLMPLISKKPDEDYIDIKLKKTLKDDESIPLRYYFINNDNGYIF